MKIEFAALRGNQALTLVEVMVSTMVVVITGMIVFAILNTGMVLFAKNTSINVAHQQARVAVLQMEQDLHSAISIPQLVDANRNVVSSTDPVTGQPRPAAGISFQVFAAGPFQIPTKALQDQKNVIVNVDGYVPKVGQRLCLPLHQTELDIAAVGIGVTTRTLTLASNLTRPIEVSLDNGSGGTQAVFVTCFISDRYTYVVKDGELRYYKPGDLVGKVMANDITSTSPFSIPLTPAGAEYNRFVAAINLSTADHTSSRRGFRAANMFLNAQVPYRAKLCYYQ